MIKNKKGSSIILLAMVFVSLMVSITAAITISRALVVKSECEVFGHVWTKAILSEYDNHLFDEYNIMAYWGNDKEVRKKIDSYIKYSAGSKLDASIGHSGSQLMGYELGDPENFRKAINKSFTSSVIDSVLNGYTREARKDNKGEYGSRVLANKVVIDTLPSKGLGITSSLGDIVETVKSGNALKGLLNEAKNAGAEMVLVRKYMGNHITKGSKEGFFKNEWEYVIHGSNDDDKNFKFCKNMIFAIRNALNLVHLLTDADKREVIDAISSCALAGKAVVAAVIAEVWAAAESELDVQDLLDNKRVPFIKTDKTWKLGLYGILNSEKIQDLLTDEEKEILSEKMDDISNMKGAKGNSGKATDGQTYDDYLLAMMMVLSNNTRTLRIMDIIQINMKYWYYRDFNMMEYYTGVRFSISANGRNYDFEDSYK
ncbi:MAG: hypothetical protein KBS56_00795 [Clostridiales bacterium]|nr:hypothetical protein [Candidatus Crickella equi]